VNGGNTGNSGGNGGTTPPVGGSGSNGGNSATPLVEDEDEGIPVIENGTPPPVDGGNNNGNEGTPPADNGDMSVAIDDDESPIEPPIEPSIEPLTETTIEEDVPPVNSGSEEIIEWSPGGNDRDIPPNPTIEEHTLIYYEEVWYELDTEEILIGGWEFSDVEEEWEFFYLEDLALPVHLMEFVPPDHLGTPTERLIPQFPMTGLTDRRQLLAAGLVASMAVAIGIIKIKGRYRILKANNKPIWTKNRLFRANNKPIRV